MYVFSTLCVCLCACLSHNSHTFCKVSFSAGSPKQLLFLLIASLTYVPASQFTKSVLLMTAAIIIVVFVAWQKLRVSSEDSCQNLWRGWGGFPARMSHCSLFYLVSFCQGFRHFLFSFFCRLSFPHCGFLHSQSSGFANIGERVWRTLPKLLPDYFRPSDFLTYRACSNVKVESK